MPAAMRALTIINFFCVLLDLNRKILMKGIMAASAMMNISARFSCMENAFGRLSMPIPPKIGIIQISIAHMALSKSQSD